MPPAAGLGGWTAGDLCTFFAAERRKIVVIDRPAESSASVVLYPHLAKKAIQGY
jgi:hypothetical protein